MSIQFISSEYVTIAGHESHISITRERTTKRSIKPGCGAIYDDSPDWLDLRVHVVYNDSKVGCDVIIAQRKDDD